MIKFSAVSVFFSVLVSFFITQLFVSVFNICAYSSNKYSRSYLDISDFAHHNLQANLLGNVKNETDPQLVYDFGKEIYLSNILLDLRGISSDEIQIQVYYSNSKQGYDEFKSFRKVLSSKNTIAMLHLGVLASNVRIDIGVNDESYKLKRVVINPHVSDVIKAAFSDIGFSKWFVVFLFSFALLHLYSQIFEFIQNMFAKLWGLMFKDFALRVSNKAKDKLLHAYNTLFLVFLYIYLCKYYICIGSMIGTRITWIYGYNDLFLYCSCLFALVAVARMIINKRWLYLILALSLLSCFYLSYLIANNDIYVFINICIAVACYSMSYKHILRVFVFSVGLIVITEVALAFFEIIPNLKYTSSRGIRYALGANYPTDFAAVILYLLLAVWLLIKKRTVVLLVVLAGFIFIQYKYTDTRNSIICSILFALFIVFDLLNSRYLSSKFICFVNKKIIHNFALWAFLLLAAITVGLSYYYDNSNETLSYVNRLFSDRFRLAHYNMINVGFSLFGKYFVMVGFGSTTVYPKFYNFIDISYCNILLRFGVLPLMFLVVSYMFLIRRFIKLEEYRLIYIMVVIALHCMVEHHYLDACYNIFLLLMFAGFNHVGNVTPTRRVET